MKIGCIIMASGLSRRFGGNKLLTEFRGKTLIETIIHKTDCLCNACDLLKNDGTAELIISRLVLTRTKEVSEYCTSKGIDVILHELPERNDAVKLGVEHMRDCDAILFCTCDQPLLKEKSLEKLISEYTLKGIGIYRLSFLGTVGNPILFSKEYFDELCKLPAKKGGAYLTIIHPKEVTLVEADDKWELFDVDTPNDLIVLSKEGIER